MSLYHSASSLKHHNIGVFSDKSGIQSAGVVHAACSSLKKLFYQGWLLLLQLGDALTLLRHLLNGKKGGGDEVTLNAYMLQSLVLNGSCA